jgi:amidase
MHRRTFLGLAASAASVRALGGCVPRSPVAAVPSQPSGGEAQAPHTELEEATIAELAARMTRGELTSRELTAAYVARIEALDRAGPSLRAVLELDADAPAVAAQLDAERHARGPRGPLHGLPVLVKDNIDTAGRTQTTAGSLALLGSPPRTDAGVVARLRAAGAVILGKTNLSEWANIRSTHSTSGWSARGGLTRNPYALDRNTSGSSSGSAAAVAANLCVFAIGTETDGSIVSPSSICGIVGLKPTVGLVSGAGIIPISHTQDTAGPMTRTVADAAIVLDAIAEGSGARGYSRAVESAVGLTGVRIGAVRELDGMPPSADTCFEAALEALRRLGAIVVDVTMPHVKELEQPELEVLLHELKADMAAYLAKRPGAAHKTLEDLVRFNAAHAAEELRWFGQELFEKAVQKGPLDSPAYTTALATCRRLSREEGIDAVLAAQRLEVLVAPTGGPAWVSDLVNGDAASGTSSPIAAVAGYPSLTVPSGAIDGLPLGVSFIGAAHGEATLLRIASAYERATRHRAKPTYPASIV